MIGVGETRNGNLPYPYHLPLLYMLEYHNNIDKNRVFSQAKITKDLTQYAFFSFYQFISKKEKGRNEKIQSDTWVHVPHLSPFDTQDHAPNLPGLELWVHIPYF